MPPGEINQLKQFSLRQVQKYLMQSPCLHRALHKPFGYPGDYEVMRFIYERPFEGTSLFAKALSLVFDQGRAARAVWYRKELVKRSDIDGLKEAMEASSNEGCRTFDLSLFELFTAASADSSKVYVGNCDARNTSIIRTSDDIKVLDMAAPLSANTPPNGGSPLPQNPVFVLAGP